MNKAVREKDFQSTEEFIQFCAKQGADIQHDFGDNWKITTPRGTAYIKRNCKTLPIEKRGVLAYLAWGLGLLTVTVFGIIAWLLYAGVA